MPLLLRRNALMKAIIDVSALRITSREIVKQSLSVLSLFSSDVNDVFWESCWCILISSFIDLPFRINETCLFFDSFLHADRGWEKLSHHNLAQCKTLQELQWSNLSFDFLNMSQGGAICTATRFIYLLLCMQYLLRSLERTAMTSHPVAQCCSNALLLCFIDLAKGKADDRAGTRAVALGHVMVSLCLGLCIIGALSSTLVSGLSLSKGTFHPELTATESLIKERTLCLSDVNWISLSLTACMTSVTKKSCVWIIHFHWCQLWQNCF